MAVNLDNLAVDQQVVLNQDFRTFTKGLVMLVKKWMPVGPNQIVMCAIPGSDARPQGFQHHMLDVVGSNAEAAGEEADDDLSGPVADYFGAYSNLDEAVAANFAGAYIANVGTDDLSLLHTVMEQEGVAVGTAWTLAQTATLYRAFSEMFGLEEDAEIDAAMEMAAAQEKAAAAAATKRGPGRPPKETAAAPAAAPTKTAPAPAPTKTAPAPTKDAAPEKERVIDKDRWDAVHMISMEAAGLLMPIFAQNPDNFSRIMEKAEAMCRAAGRSTK
jgi:hypothetical protein